MGIVKKQVYKNTLVSYIGMIIGYVNLVLLYPVFLSTTQLGLFNLLISLSVLYALFASMGVPNVIIRYFPFFRTEDNIHNGFMRWLSGITLFGIVASTLLYIVLKPLIISLYVQDSPLFVGYFYFLIPLSFFTIIYNFLEASGKVIYQSIFSGFLKDVLLRLLTTISIILLAKGWIDFRGFIISYISFNGLVSLCLFVSLLVSGKFSLNLIGVRFPGVKKKEIINYGLFALLATSVYVMWQKIDIVMLSAMAGLSITGVYSFYSGIALVINVPAQALSRTTYQIVADSWKSNNLANIEEVYAKTSIIQMVFGCLLFMGIIINKDNLLAIIKHKEYADQFNLFLVIGLSCLVDITGGLNTYIITTSHKYRLITLLVAIASVFCIGLTYLLIPIYSGIGAALAYLITISAFNFFNWFYIKYHFGMQPFTYKHLVVIGITTCSYFLGVYIWKMPNTYLDIIVRSGITAIFYGLLTYFFKVSVDVNEKVDQTLVRLKLR